MLLSRLRNWYGFTGNRFHACRRRRVQLDVEEFEPRITPQATRTWVSGLGDDANPASRTAPAKTFAGAISHTAAGGEISVLDSGSFGTVTISKSVTIDGAGFLAGVLSSGTGGIIINAGVNDVITLRGLTINGASQGSFPGLNGIIVMQAGAVHIEDCVIENFTQLGVDFRPGNSGAKLFIDNTTIRNCSQGGVRLRPGAGAAATATIDHVYSQLNAYGFRAEDRTTVSINHSVASGNISNGFVAESVSNAVRMTVQNSQAVNNGRNGILSVSSRAKINLANVTVFGNALAGTLSRRGGVVFSFGNNRIANNSRGFTPVPITIGGGTGGATRTWVSGVGDDVNTASRTAPAKTFAGAISKTSRGGEIDVLDPGGFGLVTITKAIVIDGSGSFGSILAAGATFGVNINASINDVVVLRGLSINGAGTGLNGIRVLQARAVFIENCTISNFTGQGIDFQPNNGGCELFVSNTTISNCAGAGLLIKPRAGARAALDRVLAEFNGEGFRIEDRAMAAISNSNASSNKGNGFQVLAAAASALANLEDCAASNNGANGLKVAGPAAGSSTVRARAVVSRLTATGNKLLGLRAVPKSPSDAFIDSFGNLTLADNDAGNGSPTGMFAQS